VTNRQRRVLLAAGAVVAAVVAVVAFRPVGDDEPARPGAAPAFTTTDLEGARISLSDYEGRPVLLNFWASWCVPCRSEFPLFKEVDGKEVDVLGVVFEDQRGPAADFMEDQSATWPGLVDPGGRIARAYGVARRPGIPVTVAIDRSGRIADRQIGEAGREELDRLVAAAGRP
jgi:cytochrome c biogenesis protein CcmG/thiol:disulfide interchange protein DsbE